MIREVVKYHIDNFGHSVDPIWWGCRYSDMTVYVTMKKPNAKRKGCMDLDGYPFDVWEFIDKYSKNAFMDEVVNQLLEYYRSFNDPMFLNYVRRSFSTKEVPSQLQLELF
jgi:hypothetical protein